MAFYREPYPQDVANRIKHDFPLEQQEEVAQILSHVRDSGWHVPWIQLAALRAASGKIGLLQQWIDLGNEDPRDLSRMLARIAGPNWERDYILYGQRS